jgi:hypothetical protein
MPRISEFFGIAIYMYPNDHNPPHFHARYAGEDGVFEIASLQLIAGKLPRRAVSLVTEWGRLHQPELRRDWEQARRGEPLDAITPLE